MSPVRPSLPPSKMSLLPTFHSPLFCLYICSIGFVTTGQVTYFPPILGLLKCQPHFSCLVHRFIPKDLEQRLGQSCLVCSEPGGSLYRLGQKDQATQGRDRGSLQIWRNQSGQFPFFLPLLISWPINPMSGGVKPWLQVCGTRTWSAASDPCTAILQKVRGHW